MSLPEPGPGRPHHDSYMQPGLLLSPTGVMVVFLAVIAAVALLSLIH